jgi:hypothetical protein
VNIESMRYAYLQMTFKWRGAAPGEGQSEHKTAHNSPWLVGHTFTKLSDIFSSSLKFVFSFWFHFLFVASHKPSKTRGIMQKKEWNPCGKYLVQNLCKLCDHHAVCVAVYPPYHQLLNGWTSLNETWYIFIHHGTWAHPNDMLHKSLPPIVARQRLGKNVIATTNPRVTIE